MKTKSGESAGAWVWASYGLAAAGSVGLIAAGWAGVADAQGLRLAGLIGLMLVLTLGPLAVLMRRPRADGPPRIETQLDDVGKAIRALTEQAALSDDARRVFNRRAERQLLRRAIEEDIAAEDWDAAMVLVKELAEQFGYRADAEECRQRIEQARYETVERRVTDAVARLDGLITQRRWDQALVEAARISRLYPDSARVEGLRHRVEQARFLYKADLERRFLESARAARIDDAMTLLKELDAYLSEQEAGPFREVARGVVTKARENLGVEFKLAVQDRRWENAAAIGARIIDEFPNTRMAQEVRDMLDGIRARAAGMKAAG